MGVVAAAAFLGLTLGVAALVISVALLSGFQTHVRGRLLKETPHLVVAPAGRGPFRAADRMPETLEALPGVVSVSPVARGRLWMTLRGQALPAEAAGRPATEGLRLDPTQATALRAFPGETVTLVSSRSRLSPLGPVPIVTSLKVGEPLPAAAGRRAPEAALPLEEARRLFALGKDGATGYELKLADPSRASQTARAVRAALGSKVSTTTWEEANRALVLALRLERWVLFATVFLIVIVAGLNLAATSAVLAATRGPDAAVLAVLGASPRTVASVFLTAGVTLGVAGTAAGLLLGAAVSLALERTAAIPLPAQAYSLGHVPFRLEPLDLLAVGALSLVWSLLASLVPARAAALRDPSEALRAG